MTLARQVEGYENKRGTRQVEHPLLCPTLGPVSAARRTPPMLPVTVMSMLLASPYERSRRRAGGKGRGWNHLMLALAVLTCFGH